MLEDVFIGGNIEVGIGGSVVDTENYSITNLELRITNGKSRANMRWEI